MRWVEWWCGLIFNLAPKIDTCIEYLARGDSSNICHHHGVYYTGILEEDSNHLLDTILFFRIEGDILYGVTLCCFVPYLGRSMYWANIQELLALGAEVLLVIFGRSLRWSV